MVTYTREAGKVPESERQDDRGGDCSDAGPQTRGCRQPPPAGKAKETDSSLWLLKEHSPADPFLISDFRTVRE